MEKEFVPYQQALELKELGFNEPCFGYYLDNKFEFFADVRSCNTNSEFKFYPTAPTYSQAFRWFREKYGLHVNKTGNNYFTSFNMTESKIEVLSFVRYTDTENHYEEAELACLIKLIEIVKE
jgi:hypothetical protein